MGQMLEMHCGRELVVPKSWELGTLELYVISHSYLCKHCREYLVRVPDARYPGRDREVAVLPEEYKAILRNEGR
jgi:hypothetical protein